MTTASATALLVAVAMMPRRRSVANGASVASVAADFDKPDDAAIVKVVHDVDGLTRELWDEAAVRKALAAAGELAQRVDAIFVSTLVNDPKDDKTPARLELLSYGAQCMLRLADFSRLG